MKYPLQAKRVLFQGDSITDCGRDRDDPASLGGGYPKRVADAYNAFCPGSGTVFINKGISGNRVIDLLARYETDFLAVKPDILSILIGINDVWRRYDSNDPTTLEAFSQNYRELLTRVKRDLPDTKIVIIEPFVLYALPDRHIWREDLDPKIQAVRLLAEEFADMFIPLDSCFAKLVVEGIPTAELAEDGVHPTDFAHGLIARIWLEAVCRQW
ncbi:MAG: SGNH/GDSL hydrolase family protein [Oscillospiraceae bacterium]|jgi:lysophospholipase L1-like esterase|nr:SGNH/GDSL hydrolase family protein [Oscillospiraceae bacterium]